MNLKERLQKQLSTARDYTEKLLADFKTPEQWTHQVHKNANHALWFAGHMAAGDNFFIGVIDPSKADKRPVYEEKFGMGSRPTSNPADYPPVEEILAYMRDRRKVLLDLLASLSEADLAKPTPKELEMLFSDVAGVFAMAVWHEGLHSGQISVARRALGHEPVFGG